MLDFLSTFTIRDVLSVFTFVGIVLTFVHNKLMTDKIANNHLYHIDEKLDKIGSEIHGLSLKVNSLNTDVAVLKEKTRTL